MAAHVELSGELHVGLPPQASFTFFTPEGERLWVPGWAPDYLHPEDGTLAEGLTFRTRHAGEPTVWIVSRCERDDGAIDYLRLTPGSRVGIVSVRLAADGRSGTHVTITYRLTSLSSEGDRALEEFASDFPGMLTQWERSIAVLVAGHDRS